jgi:hypothetical protein
MEIALWMATLLINRGLRPRAYLEAGSRHALPSAAAGTPRALALGQTTAAWGDTHGTAYGAKHHTFIA